MLKGKAAIVTGSTSGIGLGIARALAEVRCNIMCAFSDGTLFPR
jgi:3-hydroxybutyrate dehydrogenase